MGTSIYINNNNNNNNNKGRTQTNGPEDKKVDDTQDLTSER